MVDGLMSYCSKSGLSVRIGITLEFLFLEKQTPGAPESAQWVGLSLPSLLSAQVMISGRGIKPHVRLPAWWGICVFPSPPTPPQI